VDYEIKPSPDPIEREALLTALEEADERAAGRGARSHQSQWRWLGVLENLRSDDGGPRSEAEPGSPFE
jgi:hypothetical protein